MKCKSDFERTILYYRKYGSVVRMNGINPISKYGGSGDSIEEEVERTMYTRDKYPGWIARVKTHKSGKMSMVLRRSGGVSGECER